MNINLTKEQYVDLIKLMFLGDGMLGILGDVMPETDYKHLSERMGELQTYFLQFAVDFGCDGMTEKFDNEDVLDEEFYENEIMPIIEDFEDYVVYNNLANKLAWRDFQKEHTLAEIAKISEENNGYFGVVLYDYEKKYWDEFDKYEYNRLEIKK